MNHTRLVLRFLTAFLALTLLSVSGVADETVDDHSPAVGLSARISDLVLPGSELEVKPLAEDATPIVLRIESVFPHGDHFRYSLIYYGLDPGAFDLKDFLQRKDGSGLDSVQPIPVEIRSVLPSGQIMPNALTEPSLPPIGGYRLLLWIGALVWFTGLIALLVMGRKRRQEQIEQAAPPPSLSDRLHPIIEKARSGELNRQEQAELERLLLGFWREKRGLTDDSISIPAAIKTLRADPEAGELLRTLERWLHSPEGAADADVAALLKPYGEPHG